MNREYIKIASIQEGEKIVSMIQYGGFYRWDFKYPFRHYAEPRYLIATEKAVYELTPPCLVPRG